MEFALRYNSAESSLVTSPLCVCLNYIGIISSKMLLREMFTKHHQERHKDLNMKICGLQAFKNAKKL